MRAPKKIKGIFTNQSKFLRAVAILIVLSVVAVSAAHLIFGFTSLLADSYPTICPFRNITGLKCPGCGIAHGFLALAQGDFLRAWNYNVLSVPLFFLIALYASKPQWVLTIFSKVNLKFVLLAVILFGVIRNF